MVVPSIPGYFLSTLPRRDDFSIVEIAKVYNGLMTEVLGYETYAAQGGDWVSILYVLYLRRHLTIVISEGLCYSSGRKRLFHSTGHKSLCMLNDIWCAVRTQCVAFTAIYDWDCYCFISFRFIDLHRRKDVFLVGSNPYSPACTNNLCRVTITYLKLQLYISNNGIVIYDRRSRHAYIWCVQC